MGLWRGTAGEHPYIPSFHGPRGTKLGDGKSKGLTWRGEGKLKAPEEDAGVEGGGCTAMANEEEAVIVKKNK